MMNYLLLLQLIQKHNYQFVFLIIFSFPYSLLLLIILLFDGFAIFVQLIIAGFFLADGQYELYGENSITGRRMDGCKGATCTEEESRKLRADCNRVQVPEESLYTKRDCDAYWASDRTAGMRLAWLAEVGPSLGQEYANSMVRYYKK